MPRAGGLPGARQRLMRSSEAGVVGTWGWARGDGDAMEPAAWYVGLWFRMVCV